MAITIYRETSRQAEDYEDDYTYIECWFAFAFRFAGCSGYCSSHYCSCGQYAYASHCFELK